MKRRWYHNSDFMVRGKNAFNTLLLQLMGFMIPVGIKLADLVRLNREVPLDFLMLFGLFFGCYLLVVYFREALDWQHTLDGQTERIQLEQIKEIAVKEVQKRIDEL